MKKLKYDRKHYHLPRHASRYRLTDLAWAAGFIEGEGTIRVYNHVYPLRKYASLKGRIEASNTDRELLDYLKALFGGSIIEHKPPSRFKDGINHTKPCYTWRVECVQAYYVAKLLSRYLKTKKAEDARRIIELYESRGYSCGTR